MIRFTIDRNHIEPACRRDRRDDSTTWNRPSNRYATSSLVTATTASCTPWPSCSALKRGSSCHDICGLDDAQLLETERWAAHALLAAALR